MYSVHIYNYIVIYNIALYIWEREYINVAKSMKLGEGYTVIYYSLFVQQKQICI